VIYTVTCNQVLVVTYEKTFVIKYPSFASYFCVFTKMKKESCGVFINSVIIL